MTNKLLSYCDALAVSSVSNNALYELNLVNTSEDVYLTEVVLTLVKGSKELDFSLGIHKKGEYTIAMADADKVYDANFKCFKRFLEACLISPDENISKKAEIVWRKVEARDPYVYKMGYDKEVVSTMALLSDLEEESIKSLLPELPGVQMSMEGVKSSVLNLDSLIKKNNEVLTEKKMIVAPSILKDSVRDLLNDSLMPYLKIMAKSKPETFEKVYQKICNYIESANAKARAQKTRNSQKEDDSPDDTDNE